MTHFLAVCKNRGQIAGFIMDAQTGAVSTDVRFAHPFESFDAADRWAKAWNVLAYTVLCNTVSGLVSDDKNDTKLLFDIGELRHALKMILEDASRPADPVRQLMCRRIAETALSRSKEYEGT